MKLIRKWNPESAMYINNPNGPKVYRILALVRDGVNDNYVCFFDSWTGKIYIEKALMTSGSSYFDHNTLAQIKDDKEWIDVIEFLSNDECQVIQMVETTYENTVDEQTGEKSITIHDAMHNLPLTKYGVDANGKQSITGASPVDMQISPSLINEDGSIIP